MSAPEFVLRPYVVSVEGFGCATYHARTPARARVWAFDSAAFNGWTFKQFLQRSRLWRAPKHDPNYGREIIVAGERAFYVTGNSQYIQFVRPNSDVILNTHPYDVEPKELRPLHYRDDPKGADHG